MSALLLFISLSACDGGGASSPDSGVAGSSGGGSGGATGGSGGATGGSGGATGGSGGATGGSGGATGGSGGASSFAAVQLILATSCVRCHDPAHPFVPETTTYVAMNLTAAGAYAALVNKPATETCGGVLVTPGDPSKSYLYAKITQDKPCDGERMPHQGMVLGTPPLPADQIAVFETWIRGGAKP
jgi:hypothetical protein